MFTKEKYKLIANMAKTSFKDFVEDEPMFCLPGFIKVLADYFETNNSSLLKSSGMNYYVNCIN